MLQTFYRRHILERFLTADELADFDTRYQAAKKPSANNLGQKTFDQLVSSKVQEELSKLGFTKGKWFK